MALQIRVDPEAKKQVEAGMPDLGLDCTLRSKRRLGKVLGVHGPDDLKGRLIADGLVRLVVKSVIEYQEAKSELLRFLPEGYLDHYHRAQDHFESCVQSIHRSIGYLCRLRTLGYSRHDGAPLVPKPREFEVLREDAKKQIRQFRDLLEHLETDIIDGKIDIRDDVGPKLGTESASIGDASLKYSDIARWCSQLHAIAAPLSYVTLSVQPIFPKEDELAT